MLQCLVSLNYSKHISLLKYLIQFRLTVHKITNAVANSQEGGTTFQNCIANDKMLQDKFIQNMQLLEYGHISTEGNSVSKPSLMPVKILSNIWEVSFCTHAYPHQYIYRYCILHTACSFYICIHMVRYVIHSFHGCFICLTSTSTYLHKRGVSLETT